MRLDLIFCFLTAVCYAVYPVLGRHSGVSASWMRASISLIAFVAMLAFQAKDTYGPLPVAKSLLLLLVMGTLAGAGNFFFGKLFAVGTAQDLSVTIPLVSILTIIMNSLLSSAVLHEQISWRMGIGYVLACMAIWLIAYKPAKM